MTTPLVRRSGPSRGTALSVNAAGTSLGVLVGAGPGGVGLALGGCPGTAAAPGGPTLVALGCARRCGRGGAEEER
ncbi:hypothetical protein JNUCC64_31285 [Streptomyces sp. JNUCC 64]